MIFNNYQTTVFVFDFQNADVAAGAMYITEPREKYVDFTEPFLRIHATLLLRKSPMGAGKSPVNSLADLIGQREIRYGTLRHGIIMKLLKLALMKT